MTRFRNVVNFGDCPISHSMGTVNIMGGHIAVTVIAKIVIVIQSRINSAQLVSSVVKWFHSGC